MKCKQILKFFNLKITLNIINISMYVTILSCKNTYPLLPVLLIKLGIKV